MKKHPINHVHSRAKLFGEIIYVLAIIFGLCCLASTCNGQISMQIRSGAAFKTKEPIIAGAVNFAAHGLALTPEMIVTFKDNSPAYFGLKMSYEYLIRDELSIEGGYGRYFTLYSTDKYDDYRNGWSNLFFVSSHWRKFFLEYDYLNGSILSIGFKETIGRLQ